MRYLGEWNKKQVKIRGPEWVVARSLVNAELTRGKLPPFLIFDDSKYNQAVQGKTFKDYLLEAIAYTRKLAKKLIEEGPIKTFLIKI